MTLTVFITVCYNWTRGLEDSQVYSSPLVIFPVLGPGEYMPNLDDVRNLFAFLEKFEKRLDLMDAKLAKLVASTIQEKVDERLYTQNDTTIILQPGNRNIIEVTNVIVYVTSNGTLTLGDRTFNVTPSSTNDPLFRGIDILLRPEDTRQLVQTTQGAMGLEIIGKVLPVYGAW